MLQSYRHCRDDCHGKSMMTRKAAGDFLVYPAGFSYVFKMVVAGAVTRHGENEITFCKPFVTIELFYQHCSDPRVPIEDVAGAVKELIQEGKVRRFVLCEDRPETIRRAHAAQPVTAVQSKYHLMWRSPEQKVLPTLEELGIGFVPYNPVNRGFLGGTLNEYTHFKSGNDNRGKLPRFSPEAMRANMAFVEALADFVQTRGMTSAQVALAWLLVRKPWIVPIPGTTKLSHLEENLRAADFGLTASDWNTQEKSLSGIRIAGDRY